MNMLNVSRWSKGGHNRLYVNTMDGQSVGWLDLTTASRHLTREGFASAFHHILDLHEGKTGSYAANRPGHLVRQEADKEFTDKPIRTFLNQLLDVVHTKERAWRLGAEGEEEVGAALDGLTPIWRTVHSIPCPGGWDLDHLAVGPAGVLVVNAKHHPGHDIWVGGDAILVSGNRVEYAQSARRQAKFAADRLSAALGLRVDVQGAVVFAGRPRFKVKAPPQNLVVARAQDVRAVWRRLAPRLASHEVRAVYAAATHPSTWA